MINEFKKLVKNSRSYRRFDNSVPIPKDLLIEWVDMVRYTPSGKNQQSLKYMIINDPEENKVIFETLSWAGFLTDWQGPQPHEQPTAYIVILNDKTLSDNYFCDHGIVAQTIMLAACNEGFGGCILAAINRPRLIKAFTIPQDYEIVLVLALGKPAEQIVTEPMIDNEYRYHRDENGIHHVPKRSLHEILVKK